MVANDVITQYVSIYRLYLVHFYGPLILFMPHGYLVWANTFYSPNFFPKINYALPDLQ